MIDPNKLKVTELRDELSARGLDVKGVKAVLVKRLRAALNKESKEGGESALNSSTSATDDEQQSSQDDMEVEQSLENKNIVTNTSSKADTAENLDSKLSVKVNCPVPDPSETIGETKLLVGVGEPLESSTESKTLATDVESTDIDNQNCPQSVECTSDVAEALHSNPVEEPESVVTNNIVSTDDLNSMTESQENVTSNDLNCVQKNSGQNDPAAETSEVQKDKELAENGCDKSKDSEKNSTVEADTNIKIEPNPETQVVVNENSRGTKRKHEDESPSVTKNNETGVEARVGRTGKRVFRTRWDSMKVEKEDFDDTLVALDTYNSDLNLVIDASRFSAYPLTSEGFAFMWAGARSTFGVVKGKICYEVKVVKHMDVGHLPADEPNPHVIRVGFSVEKSTMQLGEDPLSYGYGGTAKMSTNCQFKDYGTEFVEGDCIMGILNMDSDPVQIGFAKNGKFLGWAYKVNKSQLAGQALFPHILTKNCSFEVNFGHKDRPFFNLPEGFQEFTFIGCIPLDLRERGTKGPERREECEMIMMCGIPGAGKTVWATEYAEKHPEKKYNVLGTNNIIDKMKVMGLPRKRNYHGRWDVLINMATGCLTKMFEIGSKLRRNYILDQTNVYPTAQRRKMRNFEGFKRKAVVIVPTEEEYKRRCNKRDRDEGKQVPDSAVLEMKANFKLPAVSDIFDEVIYAELQKDEAEKLVRQYNEEGKAATGPQQKRFRPNDQPAGRGSQQSRNSGGGFERDQNRSFGDSPSSRNSYSDNSSGGYNRGSSNRGGFRGRGSRGSSDGVSVGNYGGRGGRGGLDSGSSGSYGGRGRGSSDYGNRPGSDSNYGGRGSSDGGYSSRPGSDSAYGGRGGSDGGYASRSGSEGAYGGRGGADGPGYGGRGGSDGPGYGGRGGLDGPGFGGRGGSDGPGFGGRGGSDGLGYGGRGGSDSGYSGRGRGGSDGYGGRGRGSSDSGFGGRGRGGTDSGYAGRGRGGSDGGFGGRGGRGGANGGSSGGYISRGSSAGGFGGGSPGNYGSGSPGGFGGGAQSSYAGGFGGSGSQGGYGSNYGGGSPGYGDSSPGNFGGGGGQSGFAGRGGSRGGGFPSRGGRAQGNFGGKDFVYGNDADYGSDAGYTGGGGGPFGREPAVSPYDKSGYGSDSQGYRGDSCYGGSSAGNDFCGSSGSYQGDSVSNFSKRGSTGSYDARRDSQGSDFKKDTGSNFGGRGSQGGYRGGNTTSSRGGSRGGGSSSGGIGGGGSSRGYSGGSNNNRGRGSSRGGGDASGGSKVWSTDNRSASQSGAQNQQSDYGSYGNVKAESAAGGTAASTYGGYGDQNQSYGSYDQSTPQVQNYQSSTYSYPQSQAQTPQTTATTQWDTQATAVQAQPTAQPTPEQIQQQWTQYYQQQQTQQQQYYNQYYGQQAAAAAAVATTTPVYGTGAYTAK